MEMRIVVTNNRPLLSGYFAKDTDSFVWFVRLFVSSVRMADMRSEVDQVRPVRYVSRWVRELIERSLAVGG